MYDKKVTLKLISLLLLVIYYGYCTEIINNNQEQAIANATKHIDINKIRLQQQQINQDNAMAAKLYSITSIPSWRSLAFIRASRVNNVVQYELLVNSINEYLAYNKHPQLSSEQKRLIQQSQQQIY
jgi:uncharacterized membrane protein